jgi:hypothetical protein
LLRPYAQVVRTQGAALPLVATFFAGGLPIGMLTLAVLLLVRLQGGSFLAAGITPPHSQSATPLASPSKAP